MILWQKVKNIIALIFRMKNITGNVNVIAKPADELVNYYFIIFKCETAEMFDFLKKSTFMFFISKFIT